MKGHSIKYVGETMEYCCADCDFITEDKKLADEHEQNFDNIAVSSGLKPLLYRDYFHVRNKLASYILAYQCDNDCTWGGCPTHKAEFRYNSVSDIFTITWRLGEKSEYSTAFNLTEFSLIENFMQKLKAV